MESYLQKERRLFRRAVWAAIILHAGVLLGILWAGRLEPGYQFKPLAVVDFAHFDPEGGEPGGGLDEDDEDVTAPTTAPVEPEPEEAPESEARPEPETPLEPEPEPEAEPEIIESVSEEAAPLPPPPPQETKPEPKPKPKPKPVPKPAVPLQKESGTEGAETKLPGGGPGEGRGGIGGGSGQGNPDALKAYLAQVRRRLVASRKYPPAARAQKLEGVATVSFILTPDGRVVSSRLANSSGHAILDEEALAMLRRVSPFPARPKNLPLDNLSLTVPIQFSLR